MQLSDITGGDLSDNWAGSSGATKGFILHFHVCSRTELSNLVLERAGAALHGWPFPVLYKMSHDIFYRA